MAPVPSNAIRSFFDEQDRHRRQTWFFVVLGVIWMALMGCLIMAVHESLLLHFVASKEAIREWSIIASTVAVAVWAIVAAILYTSASHVLPLVMGARKASDFEENRLSNVAQEVFIAAEEPQAKVKWYILETSACNAFACGRSSQDGSIVVTRGLLHLLNRDELQAVVAHEFAHLKNGDTQFTVLALAFAWMLIGTSALAVAIVALATLAMIAGAFAIGKIAAADESGKSGIIGAIAILAILVYGIAFLVGYTLSIAFVLGLVALGVKTASSAISQSREYLADACASQWTRNPLALASALGKIAGGGVIDQRATLLMPLWIESPTRAENNKLLHRLIAYLVDTHPKTERRLELLRSMAGSAVTTDARWLDSLPESPLRRFREWVLPVLSTLLAIGITVGIGHDLFLSQ